MHDLNTIIKQNATAFSASIDAQRAAGKYVITYHDGVHLMGYTTYDSAHAAAAKLNVLGDYIARAQAAEQAGENTGA